MRCADDPMPEMRAALNTKPEKMGWKTAASKHDECVLSHAEETDSEQA